MKKAVLLIIALCILFSLCACRKSNGFAGVDGKALSSVAALEEKYPEYFGISDMKGLEIYVSKMSERSYRFSLMAGTNRLKAPEELIALPLVSAAEMKIILSSYDTPDENIVIIPWQNPISSFLCEINADFIKEVSALFDGKYQIISDFYA